MEFSIATWNVNSIRARMELLLEWLLESSVDVVCLQETKVKDDEFPIEEFKEMGYHVAVKGQKAYNGVCTLSRYPFDGIKKDFDEIEQGHKRILQVSVDGITIINAYFPQGKIPESEYFTTKSILLKVSVYIWIKILTQWKIKSSSWGILTSPLMKSMYMMRML